VRQSGMGPSSQVITLTPPLSRKPGEGVPSSRTYKGLFGAEIAENAEEYNQKAKTRLLFMAFLLRFKIPLFLCDLCVLRGK
jgi:hypothetical protein